MTTPSPVDQLRLENARLRRTIVELQIEILKHQHVAVSREIAMYTPVPAMPPDPQGLADSICADRPSGG